jgi:hypothetical protein
MEYDPHPPDHDLGERGDLNLRSLLRGFGRDESEGETEDLRQVIADPEVPEEDVDQGRL